MRIFLTSLLVVGLLGCPDAHPGLPCDDGTCPSPMVCVEAPAVPTSTCAAVCDDVMVRCDDGTPCLFHSGTRLCWPGGEAVEGSVTTDGRDCARGLAARPDFEVEPLSYTCEPLCGRDADCRSGESCVGVTCAVPCTGPSGEPCAEGSTCVDGFCMNARRFARMDCDGDGVADCPTNGMCDDSVPGRPCVPVTTDP